jgi:hypothetical protein
MSTNQVGFCTVPDPVLTPGEMDSSLACVSNRDRPRSVTNAENDAILAAYGYPATTKKPSGERDHWFPHWMGGSEGPNNICRVACRQIRLICQRQSRISALAKSMRGQSHDSHGGKEDLLKGWTKLLPQ